MKRGDGFRIPALSLLEILNNSVVSGNTIVLSTTNGIELQYWSNKNVVSGNVVNSSGGATSNYGIVDSGTSNTIESNIISDNSCTTTCVAISLNGENSYLSNNTFTGDGTYSATISDSGTNTRYASQLSASQILQSGSSHRI